MKVRNFSISTAWGRIWVGQLPDNRKYIPASFSEVILDRTASSILEPRFACMQATISGDFSGVLGVSFMPDTRGQLKVKVDILEKYDPERIVQIGLSTKLAKTVLDETMSLLHEVVILVRVFFYSVLLQSLRRFYI